MKALNKVINEYAPHACASYNLTASASTITFISMLSVSESQK